MWVKAKTAGVLDFSAWHFWWKESTLKSINHRPSHSCSFSVSRKTCQTCSAVRLMCFLFREFPSLWFIRSWVTYEPSGGLRPSVLVLLRGDVVNSMCSEGYTPPWVGLGPGGVTVGRITLRSAEPISCRLRVCCWTADVTSRVLRWSWFTLSMKRCLTSMQSETM